MIQFIPFYRDISLPIPKMKLEMIYLRMRGLAVVEMAIVIPVFLVMLFGILEFGIVLYDKAIVTNSSLQLAQATTAKFSTSKTNPPVQADIDNAIATLEASGSACKIVATTLLSFDGKPCATATTVKAVIGQVPNQAPPYPKSSPYWDGLGYPLTVTVQYAYTSLVLNRLIKLFSGSDLQSIPLTSTTTMYLN